MSTIKQDFNEMQVSLQNYLKLTKALNKRLRTEISRAESIKVKESTTEEPVKKRKPDRDWECAGRLWEKKPCVGCVKCNTATKVLFNHKKVVVCKTCSSALSHHRKSEREKKKNEEEKE